ncbi:hypothetical protein VNI00_009371 [Paramarasmius palmivorus]|uniref:Uncharacterized protein n=1 Tax=Paramarasmius palmivorus TaxID=297713 RepID=A0AAW0CRU2_9AGAR
MILGSFGLFCSITTHWILVIYEEFRGFVFFKGGTQVAEYFVEAAPGAARVSGLVLAYLTIFIADAVLVYRLWVIWSFNIFIIIFPCLSILALAVGVIGGLAVTVQNWYYSKDTSIIPSLGKPWTIGHIIWTTFGVFRTNIYCTGSHIIERDYARNALLNVLSGLIGFRIWSVHRQNKAMDIQTPGSIGLNHVLEIFLQSAFLYSTWGMVFVISFALDVRVVAIFASTLPVVTGIAVTLMSFRVGLGAVQPPSTSTGPRSSVRFTTVHSTRDIERDLDPMPPTDP